MNFLAVDIVLLPPKDVTDKIISFTSNLPDASTHLNNSDCLPHISLAMGIIEEGNLKEASGILQRVAGQSKSQLIIVEETESYKTPDGKDFSHMLVKPTDELIELHLEIMEAFRPLLSHSNVQTNMFVSPPTVAEVSTHWVKHYYDKSSPKDYHPHITLGEGLAGKLSEPFMFKSNDLALCHLGTYCTCRKLIAEVSLS